MLISLVLPLFEKIMMILHLAYKLNYRATRGMAQGGLSFASRLSELISGLHYTQNIASKNTGSQCGHSLLSITDVTQAQPKILSYFTLATSMHIILPLLIFYTSRSKPTERKEKEEKSIEEDKIFQSILKKKGNSKSVQSIKGITISSIYSNSIKI